MFKPEDFELSMESQLRLRVINDDIKSCTSVETLQTNLSDAVRLTMQYQQMLQKLLERTILRDLDDAIEKAMIEEG